MSGISAGPLSADSCEDCGNSHGGRTELPQNKHPNPWPFSGGSRLSAGLGMLLLATGTLGAQQQFTLQQAVDMAQKQGLQARAAVASRDAARAREHAFGARNLPQLSLTGTAPRFEKTIAPVVQPDGATLFVPVQQTTASANAVVSQRLPFTGGTFSVTSSLQRYEQTRGAAETLTWSSSPVTFSLEQPILRPNAMRWDSRIQDILITASERQYLEAREQIALQTSNVFFDFYVAKRSLENAVANAATNDTLYRLNKGRLEIGKIGENDLLQSELALLRARATLDNARLEYERALATFRLTLNLPVGSPLDVVVSDSIPSLDADTAVAVAQALANRAQVMELELQRLQARRRISEARLAGGPGATVNASVGFNQTAADMNLAYQDLLQSQRVSLGVSIPLIQWGARSADIQAARTDEQRVEATSVAAREQIAQDAHFATLQLALARRNVAVSAKADTVAQKRFEVAYNRYVIGRIGIDNLYIAQNEKDQAVNQYLQALKGYWGAYYRLRQLTLFDFAANAPIR